MLGQDFQCSCFPRVKTIFDITFTRWDLAFKNVDSVACRCNTKWGSYLASVGSLHYSAA